MKPILEIARDYFIQRIFIYIIITFFSFFVIVPLGDLRIRFTDDHCSRCILYSDFDLIQPTGGFRLTFGQQEVCEYSLAVVSVFCLIYPIITAVVYLFMYRKDSQEVSAEQKLDLSHFLFLVHIITEFCVVILVLVSAGLVSAGFQHTCDSLSDNKDGILKNITSCSDAQDVDNLWHSYDGSNFHVALSVATAGSWFVFVAWLCQGLLGLWKLWRLGMLPVTSHWMD